MCGIFCALHCKNQQVDGCLEELLKNRGPNASCCLSIDDFLFAGHVLWQQGSKPCVQPMADENLVLLFNGDIFNMLTTTSISDTEWLFQQLNKCDDAKDICNILRSLVGPFSLICYYRKSKELYFARDSLGRNSLILQTQGGYWQLSSTSFYQKAVDVHACEVPPLGLYKINVSNMTTMLLYPWTNAGKDNLNKQLNILESNVIIKDAIMPHWLSMADRKWNFDFYKMSLHTLDTAEGIFEELLRQPYFVHELECFGQLLQHSVQVRVQTTTSSCSNCIRQLGIAAASCEHAKIAILFSGGIDCCILALLCDKFVPTNESIDLINVAFEAATGFQSWQVPDRITATQALADLQDLCPTRKWNFIEVNVMRKELHEMLQSHIKHLIYPLQTVLDESLGSAFWFAARGEGICQNENYCSTARIVIVGQGADELFGGYVRHKNAYKRCLGDEMCKQAQVQFELDLDWQRIPTRNLARDDRVIADNGKTCRAPFIEENVVKFVRALKPWQRACYTLNDGIGDKLFLRAYGYSLGLKSACSLKKRAIQFGSKIANKRQNANDPSEYLTNCR